MEEDTSSQRKLMQLRYSLTLVGEVIYSSVDQDIRNKVAHNTDDAVEKEGEGKASSSLSFLASNTEFLMAVVSGTGLLILVALFVTRYVAKTRLDSAWDAAAGKYEFDDGCPVVKVVRWR